MVNLDFKLMKLQAGFSLSGLLASLAVASVVLLLLASMFGMMSSYYEYSRESLEAQEMAARAEVLLTNVFSQALEISNAGGAVPANLGGGMGQIADGIDYDQIGDTGDWTTLAVFLREDQGGININNGQLRKTALWYRRPNPAAGTTGVIFVDLGPDPTAVPGPAMSPSYADAFIDRVTGLRIVKRAHAHYPRLTGIDITLTLRYHYQAWGPRNWCPRLDSGVVVGCDAQAPIRDHTFTFSVLLRNNLMHVSGDGTALNIGNEERTLGSLYFFKPYFPLR